VSAVYKLLSVKVVPLWLLLNGAPPSVKGDAVFQEGLGLRVVPIVLVDNCLTIFTFGPPGQ